jgi:hypothetical protein
VYSGSLESLPAQVSLRMATSMSLNDGESFDPKGRIEDRS